MAAPQLWGSACREKEGGDEYTTTFDRRVGLCGAAWKNESAFGDESELGLRVSRWTPWD